jgi:translation initiation factor 1
MRARTPDAGSLVYSTETTPARTHSRPAARAATPTVDGIVRIWLEKKGRNGTPVSILRGLPPDRTALAALAGRLKRACGTGGSAKDGEIIIQGDHRDRIATLLEREGFRVKLAGS